MITIPQPCIALNDTRVTCRFDMDESHSIRPSDSARDILGLVVRFARGESNDRALMPIPSLGIPVQAPKKPMGKVHVVINCHARSGYLQLGTGFGFSDIHLFNVWEGLVEKIWIVACNIALIAKDRVNDGHRFCEVLARTTKSYVVASTEIQPYHQTRYPRNQIDSYEGLVLSYNPSGVIDWQHRYPSGSKANRE